MITKNETGAFKDSASFQGIFCVAVLFSHYLFFYACKKNELLNPTMILNALYAGVLVAVTVAVINFFTIRTNDQERATLFKLKSLNLLLPPVYMLVMLILSLMCFLDSSNAKLIASLTYCFMLIGYLVVRLRHINETRVWIKDKRKRLRAYPLDTTPHFPPTLEQQRKSINASQIKLILAMTLLVWAAMYVIYYFYHNSSLGPLPSILVPLNLLLAIALIPKLVQTSIDIYFYSTLKK